MNPTHTVNLPTTDPLSREQRARAEALHTAAAVLAAVPGRSGWAMVADDLVTVAVYVETGAQTADLENGADK